MMCTKAIGKIIYIYMTVTRTKCFKFMARQSGDFWVVIATNLFAVNSYKLAAALQLNARNYICIHVVRSTYIHCTHARRHSLSGFAHDLIVGSSHFCKNSHVRYFCLALYLKHFVPVTVIFSQAD